jgi:hypothetical protein
MAVIRQGCLTLIGAAIVLFTVAFATAALYLETHDFHGNHKDPRALGLILLAIGSVSAFAGAGYMMYLDLRGPQRSRPRLRSPFQSAPPPSSSAERDEDS